jgi:hypothetical protein
VSDVDAVAARTFIGEAGDEFGFLRDEFGFAGPQVDHGPFAVWVTFTGAAAAVKASFDTRDRLVEVFVVKLVGGELPAYDEMEATHYIGLESLATVAGRALPAGDLILRDLSDEEFRRVLARSVEVVKQFGDILRGDFRRFDQAIAERRAYIARHEAEYQRELQREESHGRRRDLAGWWRRRRRGRSA